MAYKTTDEVKQSEGIRELPDSTGLLVVGLRNVNAFYLQINHCY